MTLDIPTEPTTLVVEARRTARRQAAGWTTACGAASFDRSVEFVVGLPGIVPAGAAYPPLDVHAPPRRVVAAALDEAQVLFPSIPAPASDAAFGYSARRWSALYRVVKDRRPT